MIAKYPGKCFYCGKPVKVGRDQYDIEINASYHIECHEDPKPTPRCYEIADACGFVEHERALTVSWGKQ